MARADGTRLSQRDVYSGSQHEEPPSSRAQRAVRQVSPLSSSKDTDAGGEGNEGTTLGSASEPGLHNPPASSLGKAFGPRRTSSDGLAPREPARLVTAERLAPKLAERTESESQPPGEPVGRGQVENVKLPRSENHALRNGAPSPPGLHADVGLSATIELDLLLGISAPGNLQKAHGSHVAILAPRGSPIPKGTLEANGAPLKTHRRREHSAKSPPPALAAAAKGNQPKEVPMTGQPPTDRREGTRSAAQC